jgi:hypothetical protein
LEGIIATRELLHNSFVRIVAIGGDIGPLNEVASGFFKGSREDNSTSQSDKSKGNNGCSAPGTHEM